MFLLLLLLCPLALLAAAAAVLRKPMHPGKITVAFFHPYCDGGGGGERVLWVAVRALQQRFGADRVAIIVYCGDLVPTSESVSGVTESDILRRVESRFQLLVAPGSVRLLPLRRRAWVEAARYPFFTMLGQSLGSVLLACEALSFGVPDVLLDSMGYAFVLPLFRLCGSQVGAYVHYPTISTDMLGRVVAGEAAFNNAAVLARHPLLRRLKIVYYHLFAWAYGLAGSVCRVVMVNSTWTGCHIRDLWGSRGNVYTVFPPCDTTLLQPLALKPRAVSPVAHFVSIAQFRPEKDHALQLKALQKLLVAHPEYRHRVKLTMAGGVRNAGDAARVEQLKAMAAEMQLTDHVDFAVNIPHSELMALFERSVAGLHTMRDEHFGIGVVEFMAAGVVAIAHNSAGPKLDIVKPGTGFLAETAEEYAEAMHKTVAMPESDRVQMRAAMCASAARFSNEAFAAGFLQACEQHIPCLRSSVAEKRR